VKDNFRVHIPDRLSPEYWPELDAAGQRVRSLPTRPVAVESMEATRMCAGFRELYGDDEIDFKHVCSEELHL
jgi:hypothetical protein